MVRRWAASSQTRPSTRKTGSTSHAENHPPSWSTIATDVICERSEMTFSRIHTTSGSTRTTVSTAPTRTTTPFESSSTDGELLDTWGTPNEVGAPGQPFNRPTKAMAASTGQVFVSDGYGQHRVHRFSAAGDLELSWGEEGEGPGQFALPHDLWVDPRDRILVTDRTNNRIQLFDLDGTFLEEWTDIQGPNNMGIYEDIIYAAESPGRVSMFDLDGNLVGRWGEKGEGPGQFADPAHGLCVDSHGDVYVGEVPWKPDRIQKFTRV